MKITLIRHGQASFGADNYDALSDLGHQQAVRVAQRLVRIVAHPARARPIIVCGALVRQKDTAQHLEEALASAHGSVQQAVQTVPLWNEYAHMEILQAYRPDWGSMEAIRATLAREAKPMHAFQLAFDAALQRWMQAQYQSDYCESFAAFRRRVGDALSDARTRLQAAQSQEAWVVSSGGVIAAIVCALCKMEDSAFLPLHHRIANASLTTIEWTSIGPHETWQLNSFNDSAHFEGENAQLLTWR